MCIIPNKVGGNTTEHFSTRRVELKLSKLTKNVFIASYLQFYYHIVFGTKYHKPTIPDVHCELLYKYMWGIIQNKKV